MKKITTGDSIHVYGNIGRINYTVRLWIRMDDAVDGDILRHALDSTSRRYPYLCVRIMKNDTEYYYEDNSEPVCLINTSDRISLNSEETNYHVWAVCYKDDFIYLDFYHGICDGTGMYSVLSTLLYYYVSEKYGPVSKDDILTLDDPIDEREKIDPLDFLPDVDLSVLQAGANSQKPAFSIDDEGGVTASEEFIVRDFVIPEKELLRFTSANDASPGTFITLIASRAVDKLDPDRKEDLIGSYIVNYRPMLDAGYSHHNCCATTYLKFSDKLKNMPVDRQCTCYRGMTFLQSDSDSMRQKMTFAAAGFRMGLKPPVLEGKKMAFRRMLDGGRTRFTFTVSYVGQWKHKEIGEHIREFWTHVPVVSSFVIEVAAVNDNIFLSMGQDFREDTYYKAILKELDDLGIPYTEKGTIVSDIPEFPEP